MRQRTALCIAACVAALGGVACDSLPGRPDEADRYRRPNEIVDFATLYGTNCSGCHGADGQLGPARPLADPVYLAVVTPERVRDVVSHGVAGAGMPVFAESAGGTLTGPQIEALVTGIFTSWGDPARVHADVLPPYRGSNGRADHGARVYAEFCASCHGADGTGGDDGGSIVDPSFLALVSDQMLRNSVIFGRPDLGMPDWRTQGKRPLTNAEITDVVAWLMAQRRPEETGTTAARSEEMTHGG
jgi:mono/diheme cytochrome c family protein